ncbi:methyl-accepting chemotaxis protein [Xanthomonas floridensis]|uniref:Chemotaxis protein n=1 Tax=Xanthomonas floridensis TaxID=1843580 RepID=A0A1A9MCL9_9XANT|nr:methyl-accepting chemotaxis protein [Xanthomonas floridensis]MEA5124996.1 methyl-accepting chemotaxis protein [Xanthomonas floridensis]MEA5132631.1 methyl-accepting chemotaxis protein [Xanthomonas floridensis]OAG67799.1 chemotaxis protein [Xanthomonas floridensis]
MIALLQRYNVGKRLTFAFGTLILLSCGLVVAGLYTVAQARERMDTVVNRNIAIMQHLEDMTNASSAVAVQLRNLVLPTSPQDNLRFDGIIKDKLAAYEDTRRTLYVFSASPEAAALRQKIDQASETAGKLNAQVADLGLNARPDEALALLLQKAAPATEQWQNALAEYSALQRRRATEAYEAATAAMARGRAMLIGGGLAVVLISGLLGWAITRSLVRPLSQATRAAEAIANGHLDNDVRTTTNDETGRLLQAMNKMQDQVRNLISAQLDMAKRHDAGQISFRMDAAAFPGDFGRMAKDTNELVAAHIKVKMQTIHLVERYAIGDLSEDMPQLPGEKAAITTAMNQVKHNLSTMNREIKHLAQAAANGDFTARGNAEQFQYDFRLMVESLNHLMATADGNLASLSSLLQSIAAGDLTARMSGQYQGVFAQMRDDANATAEQLASIVGRIQQAADAIGLASGEIASGNQDLSQRTEQQAANLEETAASMEELTSTVRQNADHASQANQLAIGAAAVASQGGNVVADVVTTMSDIQASSKKIAEIISVIDGIAFQTNILALNAAVEAARAGEQGRGFAVVASEVRTLAQRSAGAAKEIKHLIDDSVDKVAQGATLVDQAGTTMAEIVASVQRVTNIMGEISSASQEQYAGIEQVNQTVTQMDETTQQNAALVEEATAAARAMEEQAQQLTAAVAVFKVDTQAPVARQLAAIANAPGHARKTPRASVTPASATRPLARASVPATDAADWQEF